MVAGSFFGMHSETAPQPPRRRSHRTIADLAQIGRAMRRTIRPIQPYLQADEGKLCSQHVPFLSFQKIQKESYRNVVGYPDPKDPTAFVRDRHRNVRKDPKISPALDICSTSPNLDDDGHDPSITLGKGLKKGFFALAGNLFQHGFPGTSEKR